MEMGQDKLYHIDLLEGQAQALLARSTGLVEEARRSMTWAGGHRRPGPVAHHDRHPGGHAQGGEGLGELRGAGRRALGLFNRRGPALGRRKGIRTGPPGGPAPG